MATVTDSATTQETLHFIDLKRGAATPLLLASGEVYCADHALTVDEFYELVDDEDCDAELIDGVIVVRSPVSDEHEDAFGWLFRLISAYVEALRLGVVRGSRTAVRLDRHNTRLPDILFVSSRRKRLLRRYDIDGPPDFVSEIVASDTGRRRAIAREVEYATLGVPEIWRIDIPRHLLTILRLRSAGGYEIAFEGDCGKVASSKIRGFTMQVEWLWLPEDERPAVVGVLQRLLRRKGR